MNTTMADGAEQRLDAQIAEALFGQPGMSKMDVANRVRELRGDGPALLGPREGVQPGGMVRLGDRARVTMSEDDFANMVETVAGEHGEMLEDGGPYNGWCFSCEEMIDFSRGIITGWDWERRAQEYALSAQPSPAAAVPAGWKLAPIEPTWSMRNDGREFLIDGIEKEPERLAYFLWKTMMNAAPEVQ